MKKILIYIIFFSTFVFSAEIDLLEEINTSKARENTINVLFNAIRKKNNSLVIRLLDMKKNEEKREENTTGTYGPNIQLTSRENIQEVTVDIKNKLGYTPIIVAIESGNNEMLEELIKRGASLKEKHPVMGRLTLHTACYYENIDAVRIILSHDKSLVNYQSESDGWTPLNDAVLKGNVEIVKLLLENGADPRIENYQHETSIDMATRFGKGEIVKLLRDQDKKLHWK